MQMMTHYLNFLCAVKQDSGLDITAKSYHKNLYRLCRSYFKEESIKYTNVEQEIPFNCHLQEVELVKGEITYEFIFICQSFSQMVGYLYNLSSYREIVKHQKSMNVPSLKGATK